MKILIGYDGSPCSNDALMDLQRAGLPASGTEAVVLSVWNAVPVSPMPESGSDQSSVAPVILRDVERLRSLAREAVAREQEAAEQAAARLRELFPGWMVQAESRADTPHWALVNKAAQWGADLIVVGSQGRSALGRIILGSVSQQVLHNSPCSVRIGRGPAGAQRLPRGSRVRLVLGVDGSVDSASAVSSVAARRWPAGTEVLVVGVVDSQVMLNYLELSPPPSRRDNAGDEASSELHSSLERVCDELRHSGIAATASLLAGDARKVLIQEADRIGADCIVVGAKGHTRLKRLLLGSVSASVAANAQCSVEVVRQG